MVKKLRMKTCVLFSFCLIFCSTLLSGCNNSKNCVTNQVLYYYCPSNTFSQIWIPDSSNTYSVKNILDLRIDDNAYRECQTCDGLIEVTFRHPWQDNIIELTYEGDSVRQGVMWVCSDEIDPGREGYNSGQCVVPMNDIRQQDDTLYFTIDYSNVTFFSNAIGINIHSSEEAATAGHKEWANNRNFRKSRDIFEPIVNYRAIIKSNSLSLFRLWNRSHEWSERSFYKIDKQELEKIPRTMPEKMERTNAKDDSN